MPGRWMHRVPGHGAKATPMHHLSGRQPGQASRGIAPLIMTHPILLHLAWVCLRSSTPARKGATRGVPPLPILPLPAGTVRQAGGCIQPRPATRPRRSHRRRHRGTAAPLFDRPRARWSLAGRVQDPPRLPLSTMRRGVQRLHLSAHPRRAVWRQGCPRKCRRPPVRVHHPHRTLLRPGAPIPGEGRSALAVPSPPTCPDLPPWPTHVLR
jgi:hypothetical protein